MKNKKMIRAVTSGIVGIALATTVSIGIAFAENDTDNDNSVASSSYDSENFSVDDMDVSFVMPYMEKGYDTIIEYLDDLKKKTSDAVGIADDTIDKYADVVTDEQKNKLYEIENDIVGATSIDKYNKYKAEYDDVVEELDKKMEEAVAIQTVNQQDMNSSNSSDSYYSNGGGITMAGGVNYYDGRKETWYSSNALYHCRTGEWTVDGEGFYRTAEGYYVVAASDMPQGTVFKGSKGDCIVLDSGCASGTTDYYTAW